MFIKWFNKLLFGFDDIANLNPSQEMVFSLFTLLYHVYSVGLRVEGIYFSFLGYMVL